MLKWLWVSLMALALSGCGYNTFQTTDEEVKAAWAEVLNQYQRRADLVPNLVNVVKGYAAHEKDVFTEVTAARVPALARFRRRPSWSTTRQRSRNSSPRRVK